MKINSSFILFPHTLLRFISRALRIVKAFSHVIISIVLVGGSVVLVGFTQALDPAQVGQWDPPINIPVVGTHASVLSTGKVLLWGGDETGKTSGIATTLWNPTDGSFIDKPVDDNLFCAGHCSLSDGRQLVVGGHRAFLNGLKDANIFNLSTEEWNAVSPMDRGRWYPSCTALPDGRTLVTSGHIRPTRMNNIPEIYDSSANTFTQLTTAERQLPMYPWMFVLPSGKIFYAGPSPTTLTLDVSTQTWEVVANSNYGLRNSEADADGGGGTAVALEPDKILIAGGDSPATDTVEIIDLSQPNPTWRFTNPMNFAKEHLNATILPDGKVLVTGGTLQENDPAQAVLSAEMFDPSTEAWTVMASMQRPRMYHSTAFLLPDGKVAVTGTDGDLTMEVYSPPYLFKGTRPTVVSAPSTIDYGSSFTIETDVDPLSIASVVLIRPSSVTHSWNMDQRRLKLDFQVASTTLNVQAPANANLAPPGHYMLFILNSLGVPSAAPFVFVGGGAIPPPPPPPPGGAMHVASIDLSLSQKGKNIQSAAKVTTVDESGTAVANATVTGDWDLDGTTFNSGASGTTDTSGVATVDSGRIRNSQPGNIVRFCTTDVTHVSMTYDSAADVETCDQITIP